MLKPVVLDNIVCDPPRVRLAAWSGRPYDLALATARTCYSKTLVGLADVQERHRAEIGPSIYKAGHHTPFQHGHLTFTLENVSRQFVWSFLHSHPFYNSEQQSQRYNEVSEIRATVPPLEKPGARRVFEQALVEAWTAYQELSELLFESTFRKMRPIGRIKGQDDKKIRLEANRKAIEMARYVLPLAAHTVLYHTVSALELHRYWRLAGSGDTPWENRQVVGQMKALVEEQDPDFFSRIPLEPLDGEKLPETQAPVSDGDAFAAEFDSGFGEGTFSLLAGHVQGAEELVAQAAREVLGLRRGQMDDAEALERLLNPARNPLLLDTLNAWHHSPLMRALNHATYTFRKRLSHTADSQDQRHRATPGSRPLLSRVHTRRPDVVTPELIRDDPRALELFQRACQKAWDAKNRLVDMGEGAGSAVYLLPNAVRIRFTESGSLLGLLHKLRMRTCFLAQQEIYEASMQELGALAGVHPGLARFIGPPCLFRKGLVEDDGRRGPCPEGDHWCGVPVWLNFPKVRRIF